MAVKKYNKQICVAELFAGVGGFRIGLEGASDAYVTVWNNQWEPSTKRQDASLVYQARFGSHGHSNKDINSVSTDDIPDHDLLVGGFPCQDYSVAATLSKSGGIEGKKGVLWWQIYRILSEKGDRRPNYLFFENVDRLLCSPATQRGRDFAIILASLSELGYVVEWRVINAADYGMPQRRRRTYILGYRKGSTVEKQISDAEEWIMYDGTMAKAFPLASRKQDVLSFTIDGSINDVSDTFNSGKQKSPFKDAGIIVGRKVTTIHADPVYDGTMQTLGSILVDDSLVPEEFFIPTDEIPQWQYEKGAKKINRVAKNGHEYLYSEGGMAFPDDTEKPSRTIITGEGGAAPSRFKHVVLTNSGRYRRLMPIELERLNMFPDNHTIHPEVSDGRRAFLMGNALVCGVIQRIGKSLYRAIYGEEPVSSKPIYAQRDAMPTLNLDIFKEENVSLLVNKSKKVNTLDPMKHLLVGFVRQDNQEYFCNITPTKVYYTGKTRSFPSTVALNKLYYFMPYIKGKGVRDIYLIRVARIGSKAEVYKGCPDTEPRLVFELEYIESLHEYKPMRLSIFNTYTDTLLCRVLDD